jgi:hypothetical protein
MSKMDLLDLKNVNNLGAMQANRQPADMPGQEPTCEHLEQMEEELNIYSEDFCQPHQRDFLLSFQIRKLISMLESIFAAESGEGEKHMVTTDVKGRLKKRPIRFNSVQNKLE